MKKSLILILIIIYCLFQPTTTFENLENKSSRTKCHCTKELLSGKVDLLQTNVRSLNERLDRLKTEVNKIDKSVTGNMEKIKFFQERIEETQKEIAEVS